MLKGKCVAAYVLSLVIGLTSYAYCVGEKDLILKKHGYERVRNATNTFEASTDAGEVALGILLFLPGGAIAMSVWHANHNYKLVRDENYFNNVLDTYKKNGTVQYIGDMTEDQGDIVLKKVIN